MEKTAGRVYWITGLSGAGKTTTGTALYQKLHETKSNVVIFEGNKFRWAYGRVFGYSEEERRKADFCNARIRLRRMVGGLFAV